MKITIQPNQPVVITTLGASEERAGEGRILEVSGRHAHLEAALGVEMDQAVKVEWAGHMLLGEVIAIMQTTAARIVTIEIRHALAEHAQGAAQ